MHKRTTATLFVAGALLAVPASSATPPRPSPQTATASRDQVPVFRVTVVGRMTPAINYRPRKGDTEIDFGGTPLLPHSKGHATVRGRKGYIDIDAKFDKLQPASRFGREYLTYVLWAITPEGRATNLGELQVNGDDGRLHVTTELQAFGLVVTAEPYFAVTQPSDVVVMENAIREGDDPTIGNIAVVRARYELLKRGSYLMNQEPSRLRVKALEPGAPLDLAEARNAVELARLAGADRDAPETFDKAARLLIEAERSREHHRPADEVMMPARQAAQTAEDARLIALRKQEEAYAADQQALARQRETAALDRAISEESRRRQAELDMAAAERQRQEAEAARLAAERDKRSAEAARVALERERQGLDEARAAAEREKQLAEVARIEADRQRAAAERERAEAQAARTAAESARGAAESRAQEAHALAAQSEREKAELRERLRQQLNVILETRETARGLIVNLSDVLFDTGSANLKPGAREKVAKIAGILLAYPGLTVEVDGHTDNVGDDGYNQRLSEHRADSVRSYLVQQGIPPVSVTAAGFGEAQPVATNGTSTGRQLNRRVELVVSGDPIGTARRDR
jgi:outer membrane protein OmpA-like peptidoglycan-associated protein